MKKTLFIILALCSMSYGLSGYSLYKTYVAKDTVTHINLDSNFYRGVNWSNKLADTIDRNFIRWYDFNSHDSTLRYFKVDTIRSNPNVDSITGDITITGSPTITGALTVDSLKSTKGINATGGTFSGRVTGTDIDVSDSVKGVTGNYTSTVTAKDVNVTDLISGYIPYKSTNLENSNIFTNGTNTSIGKSSIESWGVSQRAVQVGGNTAIMGNALESGSNFTWLLNNVYYDGTWKPYSNGSTSSFRIGATGILFEHDTGLTADIGYSPTTRLSWTLAGGLNVTNKIVTSDSIIAVSGKFTGALSATTLNTGYGNNELHPMDQGVRTTDSINALTNKATRGHFDSLQLGTGSYLKNYVEGSFPCTLKTTDVTVQQIGTINYAVIGNIVTLKIPEIYGESNSGYMSIYCGSIPSTVAPANSDKFPVAGIIIGGNSTYTGTLTYSSTSKMFFVTKYDHSPYPITGSKGISRSYVTYIK